MGQLFSNSRFKNYLNLFLILLILLVLPLTVFLVKQKQDIRQRAQVSLEKSPPNSDIINNGEGGTKFVSNEILVKLKPQVAQKAHERKNTINQIGDSELDEISRKAKVAKIEPITKTSQSNASDLDKWFKVTLSTSRKIFDLGEKKDSNRAEQRKLLADADFQLHATALSLYKQSSQIEAVEPNYVMEAFKVSKKGAEPTPTNTALNSACTIIGPSSLATGQTGTFTATSTGTIIQYLWGASGGSPTNGLGPIFTWSSPTANTYSITLQVTDSTGANAFCSKVVTVSTPTPTSTPTPKPIATSTPPPTPTEIPTPTSANPTPTGTLNPNSPNDYYYTSAGNELWSLHKINAGGAWDKTVGNRSIVVAVSDTGIDYNHPDLIDNIWVNPGETGVNSAGGDKRSNGIDDDGDGYIDDWRGWDFINNDADPMDDHGHGTHVAGTIGAVGNNDPDFTNDTGKRIVGVNQQISLMAVKGLSASGSGSYSDIAETIRYATDRGASVINMSLGGLGQSQLLNDALKYAYDRNVILVVAAGNSTADAMKYSPASSPYVITVAASNEFDEPACFTNFGSKLDLAAPGGDSSRCGGRGQAILSARAQIATSFPGLGTYYALLVGTSMATPHVAGVAAMVKLLHPDYTNEEVRFVLRNSADDVQGSSWGLKFGQGRLNAAQAVNIATPPTVVKIASPQTNDILVGSASVNITGSVTSRSNPSVSWKLEYGLGESPGAWTSITQGSGEVINGQLGVLDLSSFQSGKISLRLSEGQSEDRILVGYDKEVISGFPKSYGSSIFGFTFGPDFATGDLNGDGKSDFIAASSFFDNKLYAWQIDGTAVSGWPVTLPGPAYYATTAPAVADIDGDGKKEVAISYIENDFSTKMGHLAVFNADGSLRWKKDYLNSRALTTPALVDIDGDGKKEIVYRNCGLHVYRFDGSSELPGWPVYPNGYVPGTTACFDLYNSPVAVNLDGPSSPSPEILVYWGEFDYNPDLYKLYVFNSDGTIRWTADVSAMEENMAYSPNPAVANLDGDSNRSREVIIQTALYTPSGTSGIGSSTRKVYGFKSDGTALPNFPKVYSGEIAGGPATIADLNNDGQSEIILPGEPGMRVLDSTGNDLPAWEFSIESVMGSATVADFDGDGKPEILIGSDIGGYERNFNHGIYVVKEAAGIIWSREYSDSWGDMAPIAGDFDNDGQLEIAGALGSQGGYKFYIWKLNQSVQRQGFSFWDQYGFDPSHTRNYSFRPLAGVERDSDKDGWSDTVETLLGTNPNRFCPTSSNDNAWPPDVTNDGAVTGKDISKLLSYINGTYQYNKRYDLNLDGRIDSLDLELIGPLFTGCTP